MRDILYVNNHKKYIKLHKVKHKVRILPILCLYFMCLWYHFYFNPASKKFIQPQNHKFVIRCCSYKKYFFKILFKFLEKIFSKPLYTFNCFRGKTTSKPIKSTLKVPIILLLNI